MTPTDETTTGAPAGLSHDLTLHLTPEEAAWLEAVVTNERDHEVENVMDADGSDDYWTRGIAAEKASLADRVLAALAGGRAAADKDAEDRFSILFSRSLLRRLAAAAPGKVGSAVAEVVFEMNAQDSPNGRELADAARAAGRDIPTPGGADA